MTHLDTLKQALEALELMYACYAHQEWISHKQQEEKILAQCVATTMTLRQAIAEAEKQEQGEPCPDKERTEYLCKNRHQCWEPCGELGKSEEHTHVYQQEQEVPEGYKLVMVPNESPTDEPDWDECIRQAEISTGLKVERHTLSIVICEVRRWLIAKQEPVAWMKEGWGSDCSPYIEFYRDDEMGWRDRKEWTPLYTNPQPKREPLTDEEIEREWQFLHDEEGNPPDHHDFARAIEAKLKEKNT